MCGILAILGEEIIHNNDIQGLRELLSARGPDFISRPLRRQTNIGLDLTFHAAILHLRGQELQKQPLIDSQNNILLFNGLVYKFDQIPVDFKQSDTLFISNKLSSCATEEEILNTLAAIDGPFAFIYWNERLNTLFYGRDIFGRKSLCCLVNNETKRISAISTIAFPTPASSGYTWLEVDSTAFHCLRFEENNILRTSKYAWYIDSIYRSARENIVETNSTLKKSPISSLNYDIKKPNEFSIDDRGEALQNLESKLIESVKTRLESNCKLCLICRRSNRDYKQHCDHSKVLIAFSGGIDSTLLALAVHKVLPIEETIDLSTVAFKDISPDRISVGEAYKELRMLCPNRNWRLILADIDVTTLQDARRQVIRKLISPCNTVIDDSLGCACWFIGRATGRTIDSIVDDDDFDNTFNTFIRFNPENSVEANSTYSSPATIIFVGSGIDEQLGGYSSHRAAWKKTGTEGLLDEICLQMRRLPTRNLGRDDRVYSHHGRDVKLPYLDFDFVSCLNKLPVGLKMNLDENQDLGPKKLLRELSISWGLKETGRRVKRALQFGTRIANLEAQGENGNDICSRL